jgi:hypothetical protein
LISLSFSSPVFSSTTIVAVDIGFGLKLEAESRPWKVSKTRVYCAYRSRREHALVILRNALSAEDGRREEAKIASLCRVLSLGVRPPDELRVDIDVHGRWVIGGVVLLF